VQFLNAEQGLGGNPIFPDKWNNQLDSGKQLKHPFDMEIEREVRRASSHMPDVG
jgi:hypothetical protein